jgi:hypothetical protein
MPAMAERYAMYNMFLGLRAATQSTDDDCAMAVLDVTKAAATEWSRTHEDPDLAADRARRPRARPALPPPRVARAAIPSPSLPPPSGRRRDWRASLVRLARSSSSAIIFGAEHVRWSSLSCRSHRADPAMKDYYLDNQISFFS